MKNKSAEEEESKYKDTTLNILISNYINKQITMSTASGGENNVIDSKYCHSLET